MLSIAVGTDGKPYSLKVVNSAGPGMDRAAVDSVGRWRFKPATCDGEPTEQVIAVEVAFRLLSPTP